MAVNKVTYGGETLIDLTGDTVTADKLVQGITAHDASGAEIIGTLVQKASKLMSGTVTPTGTTTRSITVNHGLGVTPNFALLVQSVAGGLSVTIIKDNAGYGMSVAFTLRSTSSSTASHTLMIDKTTMDSTSVTFAAARPEDSYNMVFRYESKYLIGVI